MIFAAGATLGGCRDRAEPRGEGAAPAATTATAPAPAAPSLPEPTPVPAVASHTVAGRPVVFVGLDGADWQLLDALVAEGRMPNLAALRREGVSGALRTEHPPLSPIVWTTMMTGRSPLEHGILDFVRVDTASGLKEPITSDERRVPAIWNLATWGGKKVSVLGLWATYPAEPVAGTLVSDRLFSFLFVESQPPAGAVYPAERQPWATAALGRAEAGVDEAALRRYLPWLSHDEYQARLGEKDPYAHPVSALRRILVETRVFEDLATSSLRDDRPDLTVAYFEGTDSIGHVFAPFAPPRQPTIAADDYERYHDVPARYFAEIDALLGRFRDLAKARGAVLVVASDHGFLWQEGRPDRFSSFAAATAGKWHRNEGVYLLWGEGVPASGGRRGEPAGVRQVCATLGAILGLPPGRAIAGPPLPGTPVAAGASTEKVDYDALYRPMPARRLSAADQASARADLQKLQALGYIGAGESAASAAPPTTSRTAGSYNNEALILRSDGRSAEAEKAFEQAIALDPNYPSALWNLSDLLFQEQRDLDRSDRLLLRAVAAGSADGKRQLIGRAIGYQRSGQAERALRLMDGGVQAMPEDAEVRLFHGRYRLEARDCPGALEDFQVAVRVAPERPDAWLAQGMAQMCLGDAASARASVARAAELDPRSPEVRGLLEEMGGP